MKKNKVRVKVNIDMDNYYYLVSKNLWSSQGIRKIIEYDFYKINHDDFSWLNKSSETISRKLDSLVLQQENEKKISSITQGEQND